MIGIVIVSHSQKISDGLRDMAQAMTDQPIKVSSAGGMDDGSLGTDALKIKDAIEDTEDTRKNWKRDVGNAVNESQGPAVE